MKTKSLPFQIKAAGTDDGLEEGQFTAYASVFGNVDSYGDIVDKGAFTDTLKEWEAKDAPIPLLWGHDIFDMFNNIGEVLEAKEDDHGLLVKGQFDLDNPNGRQGYKLAKTKRVTDLSFAFDVVDSEEEVKDEQRFNHLKSLKLYEVSMVPFGANDQTEFVGVKAALRSMARRKGEAVGDDEPEDSKSEVKSLSDDQLKQLSDLHTLLGDFLGSLSSGDSEDEKGDDEAGESKSSEERSPASLRMRLLDVL